MFSLQKYSVTSRMNTYPAPTVRTTRRIIALTHREGIKSEKSKEKSRKANFFWVVNVVVVVVPFHRGISQRSMEICSMACLSASLLVCLALPACLFDLDLIWFPARAVLPFTPAFFTLSCRPPPASLAPTYRTYSNALSQFLDLSLRRVTQSQLQL